MGPAAIVVSVVVVLVVGAFIAGLAVSTFTGKQMSIQPAQVFGTPEQQAVRAWLKENTDSGQWEEVRWYRPVLLDRGKPGIVVKLKYRTSYRLFEHVFLVRAGIAVRDESWEEKGVYDIFSDDAADTRTAMERHMDVNEGIRGTIQGIADRMKNADPEQRPIKTASGHPHILTPEQRRRIVGPEQLKAMPHQLPQHRDQGNVPDTSGAPQRGSGGLTNGAQLPKSQIPPHVNMPGMPGHVPGAPRK